MISMIVWSKDRAMQLDLLLRSIKENIPETFDINVIYKASTPEYQEGYNKCLNKHNGSSFFQETETYTLESLTKKLILDANSSVCLSTDDTVFYRKSPLVGQALEDKLSDGAVFSLRLGFNTIIQNCHTQELQAPLNHFVGDGDGTIAWNFNHYHQLSNYGYPFGLDAHIYDTKLLESIISKFKFKNTNELESRLFNHKNEIPQIMRSFEFSIAVNVPVNCQSGITRAGETYNFSLSDLNSRYLADTVIRLETIMASPVYGAHQELPYDFINA